MAPGYKTLQRTAPGARCTTLTRSEFLKTPIKSHFCENWGNLSNWI